MTMKKIAFLLCTLALAALTIVACKKTTDEKTDTTPEGVVNTFYKYFVKGDIDHAFEYLDADDEQRARIKEMWNAGKEDLNYPVEYKTLSSSINYEEGTAEVKVWRKLKDGTEQNNYVHKLNQRDGKWLIDASTK